jgi:DNA-binding winged helix-turn-helix (wHTH) protein
MTSEVKKMKKAGNEFPVIIGQEGPLNGQRWVIEDTLTIGRDSTCNIIIPARQVSRLHARLINNDGGVLLEDLTSKNGTYCNGKIVIEPVILQDGDSLQIALVQGLMFLSSDATMPLEAKADTGSRGTEGDNSESSESEIVRGKLYLDQRSRRVWVINKELIPPLSGPQFKLLQTLYDNPDKVIGRDELIQAVWGEQASLGVSEQALDALVRRLRDRLAELDPKHTYIITVRGHGLRIDNPKE